jgi:hypothetical protein
MSSSPSLTDDGCLSSQKARQREAECDLLLPFCFIQIFNGLDEACPHQEGKYVWLTLFQMVISFISTYKNASRIKCSAKIWAPYGHIKLHTYHMTCLCYTYPCIYLDIYTHTFTLILFLVVLRQMEMEIIGNMTYLFIVFFL